MFFFYSLLVAILASLLNLTAAADNYDQCYFDAGFVGPQSLLPCLPANDTENGYSWCCMAGQNCVNQACYDAKSGMTYQYGCNDPTYKDKNCPIKGGLDRAKSPWIGLVQCSNANEGQLKYWACNHPDTCGDNCPTEPDRPQVTQSVWPWDIQPLPPLNDCNDLGKRVLAMYAPTSLGSTGRVPSTYKTPRDKPSPTRPPVRSSDAITTSVSFTMSASEIGSSTAAPASSFTSAATITPGATSSSLSKGAITGIAISSTAVVLSVVFAAMILLRRRRARQHGDSAPIADNHDQKEAGPAELPDEKHNLMHPMSPSTLTDGGLKRPASELTFSAVSPSPMSTPRTPASPYCAPAPYATHAELHDEPRVIHEMPAINERAEMP